MFNNTPFQFQCQCRERIFCFKHLDPFAFPPPPPPPPPKKTHTSTNSKLKNTKHLPQNTSLTLYSLSHSAKLKKNTETETVCRVAGRGSLQEVQSI